MPATPRMSLPYPEGTDDVNVPLHLQQLAEQVVDQAAGFLIGVIADRPNAVAALERYLYLATDLPVGSSKWLTACDGATWLDVIHGVSTATAATIIRRDGGARAKVAAPVAMDDIARLEEVSERMSKAGGTFTGKTTYNGQEIDRPLISGARETSVTVNGATTSLNVEASSNATPNYVYITTADTLTISLLGAPGTGDIRATTFILHFTGAPAVTWDGAAWKFEGGGAPTWSGGALVTVTVHRGVAIVGAPLEFS